MEHEASSDRMSIVLFSGTVDKLMAASIMAAGGVAMGLDVHIFLTNWGLMAFKKGAYRENMKISKEFEEFGPAMMAAMQAKNAPSWMDNLVQAKELGAVTIEACGMTMELFELALDDLEEIVDGVAGVAGMISVAQDAKIAYFI